MCASPRFTMRRAERSRTSLTAKMQTTRSPSRTVMECPLWSGCSGRLVTRSSQTSSQVGGAEDTEVRGERSRMDVLINLALFSAPPQVRFGTCPLMTPLKWRSWTTRCTPSPTRWWCRTRVGSKGATGPEPGRRTASLGIWSGRRPSQTQPAAWGTEGRWAGDGRGVAARRYRREMEARQVNRLTEQRDVCERKRTMGSGNWGHVLSRRKQTPGGRTQNKTCCLALKILTHQAIDRVMGKCSCYVGNLFLFVELRTFHKIFFVFLWICLSFRMDF